MENDREMTSWPGSAPRSSMPQDSAPLNSMPEYSATRGSMPQNSNQQDGNPMNLRPKTIEELKQWYAARHLPPEHVTRFFIGKDIREPKAFGIYKNEDGDCVVYKNKSDGQRAIRYCGPDEVFAVSEILAKLKDEIAKRKAGREAARGGRGVGGASTPLRHYADQMDSRSGASRSYGDSSSSQGTSSSLFGNKKGKGCFLVGIVMAIISFFAIANADYVPTGYYRYNGGHYYHYKNSWYHYNNNANRWEQTPSLDEFITGDNADQYRIESFDGMQFEDSEWYVPESSSSYDDDDSDYDWDDDDDGGWDSDDTDWDDDW